MYIIIVNEDDVMSRNLQKELTVFGTNDLFVFKSVNEAHTFLLERASTNNELPLFIFIDVDESISVLISFLENIKQQFTQTDIPILVSVNEVQSNSLEQLLQAGTDDFIQSPFRMNALLTRIRKLLALKEETKKNHQAKEQIHALTKNLKKDIELAKQVQRSMLSRPFQNDEIEIDVRYFPSFELSGDLYQWKKISEDEYAVLICDVSGHGIASALVSMSIYSLLDGLFTRVSEPTAVMHELNRHMYRLYISEQPDNLISYYFTAIYLVINVKKKEIKYINAGHPPGLFFHSNGDVQLLEVGSPPIGLLHSIPIEEGVVHYNNNSTIFLYSDGLTEIKQNKVSFTHQQLKLDIMNRGLENEQLLDCIMENRLKKGVYDDICFIRIKL